MKILCKNFLLGRVLEEDMLEGSGEIKENEITSTIRTMQNNKSPGIDSLPVEFYKVFWPDLKESFMKVIANAADSEVLTISQQQGMITLIPKKLKDTSLVKNWRPLSLLNVHVFCRLQNYC